MEKVTCPVYTCTIAYAGQVTFYKVPRSCLNGHPVEVKERHLELMSGGIAGLTCSLSTERKQVINSLENTQMATKNTQN